MDHVLDKLFLILSLVSWHKLIESLNTSTDSNVGCVILHEAVLFLWTNKVLSFVDVSDWNCDIAVINCLSDASVQMVDVSELSVNSWRIWVLIFEWNWGRSKEIINLSLDLILRSSSVTKISNPMLFPLDWGHSHRRLFDCRLLRHDILWLL